DADVLGRWPLRPEGAGHARGLIRRARRAAREAGREQALHRTVFAEAIVGLPRCTIYPRLMVRSDAQRRVSNHRAARVAATSAALVLRDARRRNATLGSSG